MKVLKMKNLKKPMALKIGSVVKLEKQFRQPGKPEFAKVVDSGDSSVKDNPCSHCVLYTEINCNSTFTCSTPADSTVLVFYNKSGEPHDND